MSIDSIQAPTSTTSAQIESSQTGLVSSCIANLNQRCMAKRLSTPLRLIARMNFSLRNYSCELFNLTGTVGKVELRSFQLLQQLFAKAGM